ncbi:6-phosphogluconolactonase [Paraflavitalea speifideaquila]|uniref:6-phosphogluconolactonase n=1 Tax=Paraflavitalea speifideaquila TaxID=3076558 RepID=UPI0028EA29D6|nr:6-phosphogluconolactonase [Paraflavitalea speifideiaquila]
MLTTHTAYKQVAFEKIAVQQFTTPASASLQTAQEIACLIRDKQSKGQPVVLGLATGSTPRRVYKELIRLHREEGLSFRNVITFNLDEYFPMQPGALQSYRHFMQENLFNHIDIDQTNCHLPDGSLPAELVKLHCEQYEKMIEAAGGIDFQLLGIGRNGHIGFNEPGSHNSSVTRLITLDMATRLDAAAEFGGMANVPKKPLPWALAPS